MKARIAGLETGHEFPEHVGKEVDAYPLGYLDGEQMGWATHPVLYSEGAPIYWDEDNLVFDNKDEESTLQETKKLILNIANNPPQGVR